MRMQATATAIGSFARRRRDRRAERTMDNGSDNRSDALAWKSAHRDTEQSEQSATESVKLD